MPVFEWRCKNCQVVTEEIRKIGDDSVPEVTCCPKPELKRIISSVSVRKGPSWGGGKGNW